MLNFLFTYLSEFSNRALKVDWFSPELILLVRSACYLSNHVLLRVKERLLILLLHIYVFSAAYNLAVLSTTIAVSRSYVQLHIVKVA